MKKLLLGTSALIGATAMVASAQAAAPELTIGGNLDFRIVGGESQANFSSTDALQGGGDVRGGDNWAFANANTRSEIKFRAIGESDGGTSYGANIDYRYLQTAATGRNQKTDEAYIFVGGDWGRVHLGQDDGALDQLVPNAGWIAPGAYLIDDTTTFINMETVSTGDANKITYFSPDLGGFDFAISLSQSEEATTPEFNNVVELAARYSTDFGDGGFTIGLGYQLGDAVTATDGKLEEWVIGATVSFGQFSVALSYDDAQNSGIGTRAVAAQASGREFYSLGIAYDIGGGMAVGISYAEADRDFHETDSGALNLFSREQKLLTLDFGFPIMEGMAGYAGVAFSDATISGDGRTSGSLNGRTDATTYVLGTTVSF